MYFLKKYLNHNINENCITLYDKPGETGKRKRKERYQYDRIKTHAPVSFEDHHTLFAIKNYYALLQFTQHYTLPSDKHQTSKLIALILHRIDMPTETARDQILINLLVHRQIHISINCTYT